MSVIGNPLLLGGDAGAPSFTTERSVRLRSSASAYFSRTPATATNRRTFTWSGWVKRGSLGSTQALFESGNGASIYTLFWFTSSDQIQLLQDNGSGGVLTITTNAVFRDPSAWYHIVITIDTTQATSNNRTIIYVNGVNQSLTYTAQLAQNADTWVNFTYQHRLDGRTSGGSYFDGYTTEINFIDGQALTPSAFGEYDSVRNTQWKPKAYTGTYGTNGFYLKFSNPASIGADSSGNSNTWTANNIQTSNSALTTYDSMLDVPTLTSNTNANFPVLNPLNLPTTVSVLSYGNLRLDPTGTGVNAYAKATFGGFGGIKFYFEINIGVVGTGSTLFHCQVADTNSYQFTGNFQYYRSDGGWNLGTAASYTTGDVIGCAVDTSAGTVQWYKNNVLQATATGLSYDVYFPALTVSNAGGSIGYPNFGQRPFTYTPPTGFVPLNTFNLPEPTVASSDDYHKIYTYTGNGGGLQVGEIQKPASLFNLDRSLRFRSANSANLSRTPTSASNRKTFTWSGWVKRGALGVNLSIMGAQANGNSNTQRFNLFWQASTDTLCFNDEQINISTNFALVTTRAFKDPSMWYHIVVSVDTTQATNTNRLKLYINGVQETVFSTAVYPSLNFDSVINSAVAHYHGYYNNLGTTIFYNDGYLADVYFIDGQALTPTDFGAYDGNFYWTPKAYTGTYGTNGFHLEFEDNSAATAAAIGKDTSGNVNNWTPSGISVTAGVTYDSMTDVPTLTSATTANYAVMNPLASGGATLTEANLLSLTTSAGSGGPNSTLGMTSGKWYWEVTSGSSNNVAMIGIRNQLASTAAYPGGDSNGYGYYANSGQKYTGGTGSAYGASWTGGNIIGIAFDVDAGTLTFYKNGISQGVAFTGIEITNNIWFAAHGDGSSTLQTSEYFNFGQRPFTYTPPTGFKALNSFNVAEVTGDVESPNFVWIKSRSASGDHALFNSVTGVGKYLRSNASGAEITDVNSLIQFNKNGFLLGNAAIVNTSAATYVASAWKAGGAAVTNTAGSITSQVSANPSAGFSIVTYTGTGANATVGHGLGIAPKMIIVKQRTALPSAQNWIVGHTSMGWGSWMWLDLTNLQQTNIVVWNNTAPTSSVFSVGTGNGVNVSTGTYVAYCFLEIAGYSKFGSYISNNAADGPFVYTGFRPRWLMVKRAIAASGTGGWFMYDAERNTYNVMDKYLFAENSAGENTLAVFDFTSNGFKIRSNNVHVNTTAGDTYIYMAFAEHPFKYALAR